MKWLCYWGPEVVDEANRAPNMQIPHSIQTKERGVERITPETLSCDGILELLQDPRQNWDRIVLRMYSPEFFTYLHLHPCEELRLETADLNLTSDDIRNITQCRCLKFLSTGRTPVPFQTIQALERLPGLQIRSQLLPESEKPYMQNRIRHPRDTTLQLFDSSNDTDRQLLRVISYIESHKNVARHLRLFGWLGPAHFVTLAQCTAVKSIVLHIDAESDDQDQLFESKTIQKTVQYIRIMISVCQEVLNELPKCTNLRWLEFYSVDIDAEPICAIISANAQHMCTVVIFRCYGVGDALLEAIARCTSLASVDLEETGVTPEAVALYKAQKRPNWQALRYKGPWWDDIE